MSRTNASQQTKKATGYHNPGLPGFDTSGIDVEKEKDFYPTPKHALESIIPKLDRVLIWEPCCGDRRLINWLKEAGFNADGADLRDPIPCDFLKVKNTGPAIWPTILTNPPFSLAQEFIEQARACALEVYMLLPLGFLGTQKRAEWWKANEPQALFVLSKRPSFTGGPTDSAEYAWFYWGARHSGIFHV